MRLPSTGPQTIGGGVGLAHVQAVSGASPRVPELPRPPILQRIGNTPLLEVAKLNPFAPRVRIHAKAEWFNPGGSVKDRAALWMVEDAERRGTLTPEKVILEATSGNTGIALALIGAAKGVRVHLCLPANVSEERKRVLRALGAEVELTDPLEGQDGAILRARDLAAKHPQRFWHADQYTNPANPRAHLGGTGPEIWAQTRGEVTHFVAGMGTSGTLMGTGAYLKGRKRLVRVVGVEPAHGFHGIEGLKHMGSSIVPAIYRRDALDEVLPVTTEDAYAMARRLAREEGMLVGQSSGAAMCGALAVARGLPEEERAVIVTVFADGLDRYLSTRLMD
jgi:S-sulfo-L-cysteine synthase (O-acetyl-L-serine-dependent)